MKSNLPKAIMDGKLEIGGKILPCAVLEDGTRVLTQHGFLRAIGRSGKPAAGRGSADLNPFEKGSPLVDAQNLKPFIDNELISSIKPIEFQMPKGGRAWGYTADLLPKVCEVYLRARDAGALWSNQTKFASACDIIVRGLAHVGIIALVDEATGYQEIRDKRALEKILEAYISKELMKWQKRFPDEWYENLFRLRGLEWKGHQFNPPQYIGKVTNDIIYDRMPKDVLKKLKELNPPIDDTGRRKNKHHQWLTPSIGHPKLQEIITGTNTLMKISPNWRRFYSLLQRAFPKHGEQQELDLDGSLE